MRIPILAALLLAFAPAALAQSTPVPIKGFGTLAVTTSAVAVSTLTLGPKSGIWPYGPRKVYILNAPSSAGTLYVCPMGNPVAGACATSGPNSGIPITAGNAYGFDFPSTDMTVVSDTTATAVAQW